MKRIFLAIILAVITLAMVGASAAIHLIWSCI